MWQCMDCERLYQFYECRYPDGELTRVAVWRRERDYNSRVCRVEAAALRKIAKEKDKPSDRAAGQKASG